MTTIQIIKVGSQYMLPVPENIHSKAKTFEVFAGRSGSIVFAPKRKNPFIDKNFGESHQGNIENSLIDTEITKDEFSS